MNKATVIIETPFSGDQDKNTRYARAAMLDSLNRGESPFLSHLLYTQVLDDTNPEQRKLGIEAGLEFGRLCAKTVVYSDLGISEGMQQGILSAEFYGRPVEERTIPGYDKRSIEEIAVEIWELTDIKLLKIKCKKRAVVEARQVLMWYRHNVQKLSQAKAGAIYGKDHSTVNHAGKTIANLLETDHAFKERNTEFYNTINKQFKKAS